VARRRTIIGYPDLAKLAVAIEHDVDAKRAGDTRRRPFTTTSTAAPEVAATPAWR
jgi:hypothetical protein